MVLKDIVLKLARNPRQKVTPASRDRKVANLYIPQRPEKLYRMLYFYAFVHCAPVLERAG
jgi:hypothetical protein